MNTLLMMVVVSVSGSHEAFWNTMYHSEPITENGLHRRVSMLVASGLVRNAELVWSNPNDPPATRGDLLAFLAWFGRYSLHPEISLHSEGYESVEGVPGEVLGAIYDAGWMAPRADGNFHPEEAVSTGDIVLLSLYFPRFAGKEHLYQSDLNHPPQETVRR